MSKIRSHGQSSHGYRFSCCKQSLEEQKCSILRGDRGRAKSTARPDDEPLCCTTVPLITPRLVCLRHSDQRSCTENPRRGLNGANKPIKLIRLRPDHFDASITHVKEKKGKGEAGSQKACKSDARRENGRASPTRFLVRTESRR